jgi:anti-anti-sigma factor
MGVDLNTGFLSDSGALKIVVREQGATTIIELEGEWDLGSLPVVRQTMSRVLDRDPESVVLDLSRLEFIDSSGLHATVELSNRAAAQNTQLVIIRGPRAVQRVFEITGLAAMLPLTDMTESRETLETRPGVSGASGTGGSFPPSGAGRRHRGAGAAPDTSSVSSGARGQPPPSTHRSAPGFRGRP